MAKALIYSRRNVLKGSLTSAALAALGARASNRAPRLMRAWEMGDLSSGIALHLTQRAVPTPAAGEALLKVHATGLNARDLTLLRGVHIYGGSDGPPTRIPLDDNACEVLAVGPGVSRVRVGDRVVCTHFPLWIDGSWDDATMSALDFSVNRDGFLAEQVVVPEQGLVKLPDSISYQDASTLPNAGLTAWHAVVVEAGVRPGDTVLTLGTGGVSMFGMQWAKMLGARVAVTSSSDDKLARVKALGADITVNYRSNPDWHTQVLSQTGGRGVDVVLNTVGISELERCLLACGSNGRVMLIGANPVQTAAGSAEFSGLKKFPRSMIMKGLTIKGIIVGSRRMLEDVVRAVDVHKIKPIIDRVFPFEQTLEAVRYMESGAKLGKVGIEIG